MTPTSGPSADPGPTSSRPFKLPSRAPEPDEHLDRDASVDDLLFFAARWHEHALTYGDPGGRKMARAQLLDELAMFALRKGRGRSNVWTDPADVIKDQAGHPREPDAADRPNQPSRGEMIAELHDVRRILLPALLRADMDHEPAVSTEYLARMVVARVDELERSAARLKALEAAPMWAHGMVRLMRRIRGQ